MDQFEAYFRRADLDQDGRISGAEAVGFLQGSKLSKQVLAQIWMHADRSHSGFLSREEFYNALKLVTVAQSKRELTPDIVKLAIYGPASAKIPPPTIDLSAISAPPQGNSPAPAPPVTSQNLGFRGAAPQIRGSAPQMGGSIPQMGGSASQFRGSAPQMGGLTPQMGGLTPQMGGLTTQMGGSTPQMGGLTPQMGGSTPQMGGLTPQMGGVAPVISQNVGYRGQVPQNTGVNQQYYGASQSNQQIRGPPPPISGGPTTPQGVNNNPNFPRGGNMGGPGPGPGLQNPNMSISSDWLSGRSNITSGNATMQTPTRGTTFQMTPHDSLSNTPSRPALDSDIFSKQQNSSYPPSSALVPVGPTPQTTPKPDPFQELNSTYSSRPSQPTQTQPKPNQQVSPQVIPPPQQQVMPPPQQQSGMPGGNSEIPWPKMTRAGVQKYAKVFMEVDTHRIGRISGEQARNLFLSWRLPREVLKQVWDLSDQDNDSMLSLREFSIALYLMERFREGRTLPPSLPSSIMLDETLLSMVGPPTNAYGQWAPGTGPGTNTGLRPPQQAPRPPMSGLETDNRSMQFTNGDQSSADVATGQDPIQTQEEKAVSNEKVYMDSKEKLDYYRTKMQDLVLYKSRCDNRLNEITERAIADKRESEMLGKKYEEKYKQVAEIASKLTIEEASFREVQERKTELQQAITKMEQGGSADGILQVRADRIQSDLEELLKALSERCKKHGVDVKSTALIELPPGWKPGVPEIASVWDEEWDKFEDEGFTFDVNIPKNSDSKSPEKETHTHSPEADIKSDIFEPESIFNSEDESKSPQASPRKEEIFNSPRKEEIFNSPRSEKETFDSPTKDYSDDNNNHFRNGFEADPEPNRSFDEPSWGTFDNNDDDIDSVWGFNSKESDNGEKYFFDSNNSGGESFRTDNVFQQGNNNTFGFEDSISGNSPRYSGGSFDSFSRFDSFSMNDNASVSSPRRETLTRFDSMNSNVGFDNSRRYSFDDSDPFGSTGPFKVNSSENQSDKRF